MSAHRTSTSSQGLASRQLWSGPRLGAELDGLPGRFEVPLSVP
ncbi:hypothetical protein LCGC14_0042800 [marine sediment metagenome]|jgi:hypothetical protein|uniref:Uncharacterized protein n=1 Tax=marine sediment metagenome TaxID=412755 RepID=A0A0F9Y8Q9_9ZZZZ